MLKGLLKIIKHKSAINGMWLYLLQIFNTVIPIFTLPFITRMLDTSQYGVFSLAINLISYYQVVVEYGFGLSATRKVALLKERGEDNAYNLSCIESRIIFARFVLLIVSTIIVFVYTLFSDISQSQRICIYILLMNLVGVVVQQDWLFQGMQEMKYISIVGIICRMVSVVLIFAFVKSPAHLFVYCILYSLSPLLSGIIALVIAIKKYNIRLLVPNIRDIWSEVKDGWYVFTTSFSSRVLSAIGITFLGFYSTTDQVGIYAAIQKIPNVIIMLWSPISQVIYPITSARFCASFKEGQRFVASIRKKILPLFIFPCLIIGGLSKGIIGIAFGEAYAVRFYWLIPLLVWVILSIDNNFYGVQTLLGSGHDKEYSKCFQFGILSTVILNFWGIYIWGADGAAVAPVLSEIILNIMLRYSIKKISKCEKKLCVE